MENIIKNKNDEILNMFIKDIINTFETTLYRFTEEFYGADYDEYNAVENDYIDQNDKREIKRFNKFDTARQCYNDLVKEYNTNSLKNIDVIIDCIDGFIKSDLDDQLMMSNDDNMDVYGYSESYNRSENVKLIFKYIKKIIKIGYQQLINS